jgi:hypothetical protein
MGKLTKLLKDKLVLIFLVILTAGFFYPVFLKGKIPIPADTIVGMYHPWRDIIWNGYTSGVPFKNYLITDPVRQQYVWRKLAVENLKQGQFPLWNPYSFSGYPLYANFQSAIFNPLNILYFFSDFNSVWTFQIMLQPLFASVFMYILLRSLKIGISGSFISSFVYAFSGFSIAWMEWNTIGFIFAFTPLLLFCIEKIFQSIKSSKLIEPKNSIWYFLLIISMVFIYSAGHLQLFFYSILVGFSYSIFRFFSLKSRRFFFGFLIMSGIIFFCILTFIQWYPELKFINLSARNFDQVNFFLPSWFIPWQNLIQFLIPDFFGNPATGNYWGVWNYGEFIGYIGIIPLISALYAVVFGKSRLRLFFICIFILSLLFALPNPISFIPYQLKIP